jgi:hypothetical protein
MGVYIYSIRSVDGSKLFVRGIGGKPVFSVPYKKIEAIVSNIDINRFGSPEIAQKAKEDVGWIVKHVTIHENVIEAAMGISRSSSESGSVESAIPMVFGTMFHTQKKLAEMMKKEYNRFNRTLKELDGKQEWSVKVYVDEAGLKNLLKKKDKSISQEIDALKNLPLGVDYFKELSIEERLKDMVDQEAQKYVEIFFKSIKKFSLNSYEGKILAKDIRGAIGEMILKNVDNFRKNVGKLERKYKIFTFDCTGPWPPYNFI